MTEHNTYKIIIGGGGTGGHVFPAISIANALGEMLENARFLFVGAKGKMEMQKVPEAGYEIVGLPVAGFQRKLSWKNISFFFKLFRSLMISRKLIREFKPDIAIGVGGYASGPIVKAASRKRIPVLIQEQNSYAGVTNRILGKTARKICVAYEGMEKYFPAEKIVFTGNPIRQDLLLADKERKVSMDKFSLRSDRKTILMIGGSLGSRSLNESVEANTDLLKSSDVQLLWQCGSYYHEWAKEVMEAYKGDNIVLLPFIREMNRAFQAADLIISRAGAGTISELCLIGKPVILVPSPNVAEDHQASNARALTEKDAAEMIVDREAREKLIPKALELLTNEERLALLSENISKLAITDSADRIAKEVIKILGKS